MQLSQQGANPSLGFLTADKRDLAAVDVIDAAAELSAPGGVNLDLIGLDVAIVIKAQQAAVDDRRAVVRSERKKRPLDLCDLRCHAANLRQRLDGDEADCAMATGTPWSFETQITDLAPRTASSGWRGCREHTRRYPFEDLG